MKRRVMAGLLGACLLWAALPTGAQELRDTRLRRIDDPLRAQFPASEPARSDETMRATIRTAAAVKGWRVESDTPSRMELGLQLREHRARVEVTYLGTGYVIRYLSSENLLYEESAAGANGSVRAIHANYNAWLRGLAQAINAGLGTSAILEVPQAFASATPALVAVGAGAASASRPPADGMPALGTAWKYGYRDRRYDGRQKFFTVEVAGVEETRVRERLAVEGGGTSETLVDVERIVFLNRQLGPSTNFVELSPYPRDLQKASQAPAGYPSPSGSMWKISAPKYGEEDVRVPAGTFKAQRVEVRGTSEVFGSMITGTARFVYVAWYSRELNRYVRIHHETWNRQNAKIGDEDVQLVGYQPGK